MNATFSRRQVSITKRASAASIWLFNMIRFRFLAAFLLAFGVAHAETTLPCIFSDHMVLQAGDHVPFWGKANPAQIVKVSVAGKDAQTTASPDGRWRVNLDLHDRIGGPYQLTIDAGSTITISDVLVGEVWLASGQSNMEFELRKAIGGPEEVAQSANSQLREFRMPNTSALEPLETCKAKWEIASPETSGNFTAVGYYFAKELQGQLHAPVALIGSYYGGSDIEAWLSPGAFDRIPQMKPSADTMREEVKSFPDHVAKYQQEYKAWQAKWHREDPPVDKDKYAAPDADLSGWKSVEVPGSFTEPALPNGGVVWLRKTVDVPQWVVDGKYRGLNVGLLRDTDRVYWNGVEVGRTTPEDTNGLNDRTHSSGIRRYIVSGEHLKVGKATIAIRIFDPVGPPSISDMSRDQYEFKTGSWMEKIESTEPPVDEAAKASFPRRPPTPPADRFVPSGLFNAMINPIVPYGVKGVIWYQGESNTPRASQYRESFPGLINDWRALWGQAHLPFYFCQLANYQAKTADPKESGWAELRDAQSSTLALPDTGQAVIVDVGEENDIHPRDKKTVSHRLALIALTKNYGKNVAYSGPMYKSSERDGAAIRIHFDFVAAGLKATPVPATFERNSTQKEVVKLVRNSPNSQLEGFQICGADHKWVWADARIDGATVLVSSSKVADPLAVRYAWADNPTVNLYNSENLPASPFRTDDFPLSTKDEHF